MQELEVIETGAMLDMKIENDKLFVVDDQERFEVVSSTVNSQHLILVPLRLFFKV